MSRLQKTLSRIARASLYSSLLLLSTVSLQALAAVEGTLTRDNFSFQGCEIASMTAQYHLDTLFGEPVEAGTYQWTAGGGTEADCLPYDTNIAFKLVFGNGATAWIHESPVVPDAGGGYGYQVKGSPDWNEWFCGLGVYRNDCLSEADAKASAQSGIDVVGFVLYNDAGVTDSGAGTVVGDSDDVTDNSSDDGGGEFDPADDCPAPPQFEYDLYNGNHIDPDAGPDTYITTVYASDLNDCPLSYDLWGNDASPFYITSSGSIFYRGPWPTSPEQKRHYSFRAVADNGNFSGETQVEVNFPTLEISRTDTALLSLEEGEADSATYTVTNASLNAVEVDIRLQNGVAYDWLEILNGERTVSLASGESVDVTLQLGPEAEALPPRNTFYKAGFVAEDITTEGPLDTDVEGRAKLIVPADLHVTFDYPMVVEARLNVVNDKETPAQYTVSNNAADPLSFTVSGPAWLDVGDRNRDDTVEEYTLEPNTSKTFDVSPTLDAFYKPVGQYTGTLSLTSQTGERTIEVTLNVREGTLPTMTRLDSEGEDLSWVYDPTASNEEKRLRATYYNEGEQRLSYQLQTDAFWLAFCAPQDDNYQPTTSSQQVSTSSTSATRQVWSSSTDSTQLISPLSTTIPTAECYDPLFNGEGGSIASGYQKDILFVPGGSIPDAGVHETDVRFLYQNQNTGDYEPLKTVTARMTVLGREAAIEVVSPTPWQTQTVDGLMPGDYLTQQSRTFEVHNISRESVSYRVTPQSVGESGFSDAVTISNASGTLAPGEYREVIVDLNGWGYNKDAGSYSGELTFSNESNGVGNATVNVEMTLNDRDGDGRVDAFDAFPDDDSEWADLDGDGVGNNSDDDIDGDGVLNVDDAFPANENEWSDVDGDGIGDNSDPDNDNDGIPNEQDSDPLVPADSDGDGVTNDIDLDDDNDGVLDENDAFPLDASESKDTDGNGVGNNADKDDDGDGMPDEFEIANGLNTTDAFDASADSDGDGESNLEEYNRGGDLSADDVPPVITAPEAITVDSTGALTEVELGDATAEDAKDGSLTPQPDDSGPFAPGAHTVTWSAFDAAGNQAEATQTVNVIPLIEFGPNQTAVEGSTIEIPVYLNGPAVTYPVEVEYLLQGDATLGSDYELTHERLSIEQGTETRIEVTLNEDNQVEGDEQLILALRNPSNAALGAKTEQALTLREVNLAPYLQRVEALQSGKPVTTAYRDQGPLTLVAIGSDPNPEDTLSYQWQSEDGSLNLPDAPGEAVTINPEILNPGQYNIDITVTDSAEPPEKTTGSFSFLVKSTQPSLSAADDTDGDGLPDAEEGVFDNDGDRIENFRDPNFHSRSQLPAGEGFEMQSSTGTELRLGQLAFYADHGRPKLSQSELASEGIEDTGYDYPHGVFDFEVLNVETGGTVNVVLPLEGPIEAGMVYRKYDADTAWYDYVESADDVISSAEGSIGNCPSPGSGRYTGGLTPGHLCVQLTLLDGGANDADGLANGRIMDPGGLAMTASDGGSGGDSGDGDSGDPDSDSGQVDDDAPDGSGGSASGGGSGGGALSAAWLLLLTIWGTAWYRRRATRCHHGIR